MKIIYAGIRTENYRPRRAESFEYHNFYLTLAHMPGVQVIEYPYDTILSVGKKRWNEGLRALVERETPDAFFTFMYTDEFDPNTLDVLKKETTTIAW